jgi:hypothetical protein
MNQAMLKEYAARMGRRVPLWMAEQEVTRIVMQVARGIAPSFVFGYHSRADIEQEAVAFALEVLDLDPPKYDPSRPLENFLHVHLRNQLSNFRRKHYARLEPPCSCCDPQDPPASPCKKFRDWKSRNASKQNLMRPIDMSAVSDDGGESRMHTPSAVVEDAVSHELMQRIDSLLPIDLRSDYLRMRDHVMIPKARRQRVREAVLAILRPASDDYRREEEEEDA